MHPDPVATAFHAGAGPVVVVDDDNASRDSLGVLIEASGSPLLSFASAEALMAAGVPAEADCLLVDVRLGGGMDGITLIERLRQAGDRTPAVVVTGHGDIPLALRAMRAGATDFVEKPYTAERLFEALAHARRAAEPCREALQRIAALTRREREVMAGLVDGKPNKVVAHDLAISVRTVEAYRANIMEKLEVRSLAELVRLALASGIGSPMPRPAPPHGIAA